MKLSRYYKKSMKTAILYIRVSTDEQAKRGYSLAYQEEMLRHYCLVNDIYIIDVVFEDFSAKNFKRPAWSAFYVRCKNYKTKRPDYILFTLWSRFSRSITEAYIMIKKLQDIGIIPQAVEQPLDMTIPENKIVLASYLATAEVENERKSLCVKANMYRAKMQGRWMGAAPIGYCNKTSIAGNKYIAIQEPEAAHIRDAFEQVSQGLFSVNQIYQMAAKKGLRCSLSNFWHVLKNPFYCGKIVVQINQSSPVIVEGQHEKLISPVLFDKVQQVINKRGRKLLRKSKQETNELLPFRGFLYCPKCKKRLTGSGSQGRHKRYFYYHCSGKCDFRVRADEVHRQFLEQIKSLEPDLQYIQLFKLLIEKNYKQSSFIESGNKLHAIRKLEDLQDHICSARTLLLSKDIDAIEYSRIKLDCEVKIEILKNRIDSAARSLALFKGRFNLMGRFLSTIDIVFEKANIFEKRQLINHFYEKEIVWEPICFIKYLKDSVHVVYDHSLKNHNGCDGNIMHDYENLPATHKKVLKIEQSKGRPLTTIQTQNVIDFLYGCVKFTIGFI